MLIFNHLFLETRDDEKKFQSLNCNFRRIFTVNYPLISIFTFYISIHKKNFPKYAPKTLCFSMQNCIFANEFQIEKSLKMKRLLYAVILTVPLLLTACASYYQVYHLEGEEDFRTNRHEMRYDGSHCVVSYDFWQNHGSLSFTLQNTSDQTMHLYLDECFLVRNGHASDFLQLPITDGTLSFSGKVVSIPPHTYRHFSCPDIESHILEFCDVELCPSRELIHTTFFTRETSPLQFGVRLTYSLGQNEQKHLITNSFYVNEVTNYHKRNFEQVHYDTLRNCHEEELLPVQDIRSADKFYIEY